MNTDYRITTDALDHPKLVKLQRMCGEQGIICLLRLWGFTARYHPKGILNNMNGEDIEIASHWTGEPGMFFENLIDLKLVDKKGSSYLIHDWKEHNSFAYYAPERSAQARHAVHVREQLRTERRSSVRSSDGSSPSPSPLPSPKPKDKKTLPTPPGHGDKSPPVPEQKPKEKKAKPPIEERNAKTPCGRAVRYWHRYYEKKHGIKYAGDIKKMMGQASVLLKRAGGFDDIKSVGFQHVVNGMTYLLDQEQDQYLRHEFDHFISKSNFYITEAINAKYEVKT